MSLKLVTRRPGGAWYLRGSIRGILIFEATGTQDKDAAEQIRIKREAELLTESIHGPATCRSFQEAAVVHMESVCSEHERRFIFPMVEDWGALLCGAINQEHLDRFIRKHYPKAKPSTINRQVFTPAIAVLNTAAVRGWCNTPKFQRPKIKRTMKRSMTLPEFSTLHTAAAKHLQPLLTFLAYTGCRMAEALELEWSDIDLSTRWGVISKTKTDEPRGVPLHVEVVAALANLPGKRQGRIFLTQKGQPYADKDRTSGGQIKGAWRGATTRAGLSGFTPHSLRHTCSTWLVMAGVHPHAKDEILGHAVSDMSRYYTHLPRQELIDAIDKLPSMVTICAKSVQPSQQGKRNDLILKKKIAG